LFNTQITIFVKENILKRKVKWETQKHLVDEPFMFLGLFGNLHCLFGKHLLGVHSLFGQHLLRRDKKKKGNPHRKKQNPTTCGIKNERKEWVCILP